MLWPPAGAGCFRGVYVVYASLLCKQPERKSSTIDYYRGRQGAAKGGNYLYLQQLISERKLASLRFGTVLIQVAHQGTSLISRTLLRTGPGC